MKLVRDYLRELYTASIAGWNRFWFTPADPATLGLIRICAGMMLFYTHLVWSIDLLGFFGREGRLPAEFVRQFHRSPFAWSYWYDLQQPALMWGVHVAGLVILALFTAGLWTRLTSLLAFVITVSYAHRAAGSLFGLDQINGLLALYLAVGPSGAAYSLDRWLFADRRRPPSPQVSTNLAIRLIQVHMCIVYLFAGLGKLMGETWWAGTALWGAFANYEYQTLDMTWLAAHPLLINVLSQLTVAWELSYIVLVWPRLTRPLVLALAVPLHLGIAVCMGMITFGVVMLIGNLAFVSSGLVRQIVDPWLPGPRAARGRGEEGGRHPTRTVREPALKVSRRSK